MASFTATSSSAAAASSSFTPFSADQRALFLQLSNEAESILVQNATSALNSDGNAWSLQFENKDIDLSVYYSTAANSSFLRFKADCNFKGITPSKLMDFMINDPIRLTWDRNLKLVESELIQEENWTSSSSSGLQRSKLVIFHCGTRAVSVVAGRDFTDCTLVKYRSDGVAISAGVGLEPEQLPSGLYPVTSDYVRGLNGKGCGWYLQPTADGSGTKMTYIIQTDLRGWFFASVINNVIGGSFVTFFEDLKNALKQHMHM